MNLLPLALFSFLVAAGERGSAPKPADIAKEAGAPKPSATAEETAAPQPSASDADAGTPQPSVKISLSHTDPNVFTGSHTTMDPIEFFVFVDGMPNRGGEFGLMLDGGDCVGFMPDAAHPWVVLPLANAYPGTIGQARAGAECPDPPVCYGRLIVKPHKAGGRIFVDVIPSERAQEAVLLNCDNGTVEWFLAHPAIVNGDGKTDPVVHGVAKPGAVELLPDEAETAGTPPSDDSDDSGESD